MTREDFSKFVAKNKEVLYETARKQAKTNANGDAVISRDEPWFHEDERNSCTAINLAPSGVFLLE
ncbi:MAG: hypothetical protein IJG80_09175 [Selenomonadaceae bacterium]|nr:hypothetical protein [Selenomonadaceae bacterium]MBQ3434363.1 hypothetical protein [Selenomonadaceae bacterium]